jgi:hypothetical protein
MPSDAVIHAFRLLRSDEPLFDPRWQDWSRCYEWPYALQVVETVKPPTLHNTGCGFEAFQRQFTDAVDVLVPGTVHTDLVVSEAFVEHPRFHQHDSRQPYDGQFAMVLAISYLEEIPPSWHLTVLEHLWRQVRAGGRFVLTCDVERDWGPSVAIQTLESWVGATIERKEPLLTGLTSRLGPRTDRPLKVALVDLEKYHRMFEG